MASILASVLGGYALDKIGSAVGLANGGKVPKTGIYKLHAGELVVPAHIVKKIAPTPKATSMKAAAKKAAGKQPRTAAQQASTAKLVARNRAKAKVVTSRIKPPAPKRKAKPKGHYGDPSNIILPAAPPKRTRKTVAPKRKAPATKVKRPRSEKQLANDRKLSLELRGKPVPKKGESRGRTVAKVLAKKGKGKKKMTI